MFDRYLTPREALGAATDAHVNVETAARQREPRLIKSRTGPWSDAQPPLQPSNGHEQIWPLIL
jgi:hypothetical protein